MKTIQIGQRNEILPIEWRPYTGETVVVKTIIRKGQRIQETAYYEDKVKAVPRGNAYCIGNGPSRKEFDLERLKATGQTYGCNALYRDFMPDFIFSVDTTCCVYRRHPNNSNHHLNNCNLISAIINAGRQHLRVECQ